jgi:hypothetical protein
MRIHALHGIRTSLRDAQPSPMCSISEAAGEGERAMRILLCRVAKSTAPLDAMDQRTTRRHGIFSSGSIAVPVPRFRRSAQCRTSCEAWKQ